jgi:ribonuclease BN (tRNA processing enzyme)
MLLAGVVLALAADRPGGALTPRLVTHLHMDHVAGLAERRDRLFGQVN